MAVIDLDKKIKVDNRVEVKIAGKTYKLTFDDNFTKLVSNTYVKVSAVFKKLDDPTIFDQDTAIQTKLVDNTISTAKKLSISTLDKLLGKGEGTRLWNYYNHSTNALATVLGLLSNEAEKAIKVNSNSSKLKIKHAVSAPTTVNAD